VLSLHDPENSAFKYRNSWYRIATTESASALLALSNSSLLDELYRKHKIVRFEHVSRTKANEVLDAFAGDSALADRKSLEVFKVDTFKLITYPWEWTNEYLFAAGELTIELRKSLLEIGLDLKDASAFNIQFGVNGPCLIDLGSIEKWKPNIVWPASRQFVEHFLNPLVIGSRRRIASADAWEMSRKGGMSSSVARNLMTLKSKFFPTIAILQWMTEPRESSEEKTVFYAKEKDNAMLLKANNKLNNRLLKSLSIVKSLEKITTWSNYGDREHYTAEELDLKILQSIDFIKNLSNEYGVVIDVGGNDGKIASKISEELNVFVVVMDQDVGALENISREQNLNKNIPKMVMPIIGNLMTATNTYGLLNREFDSFFDRMKPKALLCQAVLHHVVITQAIPLKYVVEALASFQCPIQIEFVLEYDEKVKLLQGMINNWTGEYSLEALVRELGKHFSNIKIGEKITDTRILVYASEAIIESV
jgi:hypothetical protein